MAKKSKKDELTPEQEFIIAIDLLEKEKGINKEILFEAIENSLVTACKNNFGEAENVKVDIDRTTGKVEVYALKVVTSDVENPLLQIDIIKAKEFYGNVSEGDVIREVITPKNFGRIAAGKAKQIIIQKIREEERRVLSEKYQENLNKIMTGKITRILPNGIIVNFGDIEAILNENEMIKGERYKLGDRIKVYVLDIKANHSKVPKLVITRNAPEFIIGLFKNEVQELRDGIIEIKNIVREAGSRTKISVLSNVPEIDPVGSCVGVNKQRIDLILQEIGNEKVDIVEYSDDIETYIKNSISPAKVISININNEENKAYIVVPEDQLSLAIGKSGQNVRLAAKLTGIKLEISSENEK